MYTEAVIEKNVSIGHMHVMNCLGHSHEAVGLEHTHRVNSTTSASALSGSYATSLDLSGAYESLSGLDGLITVTEGIRTGDVLLMLRVSHGQQFIVLSKLRASKSVTIDKDNNWNWS